MGVVELTPEVTVDEIRKLHAHPKFLTTLRAFADVV